MIKRALTNIASVDTIRRRIHDCQVKQRPFTQRTASNMAEYALTNQGGDWGRQWTQGSLARTCKLLARSERSSSGYNIEAESTTKNRLTDQSNQAHLYRVWLYFEPICGTQNVCLRHGINETIASKAARASRTRTAQSEAALENGERCMCGISSGRWMATYATKLNATLSNAVGTEAQAVAASLRGFCGRERRSRR